MGDPHCPPPPPPPLPVPPFARIVRCPAHACVLCRLQCYLEMCRILALVLTGSSNRYYGYATVVWLRIFLVSFRAFGLNMTGFAVNLEVFFLDRCARCYLDV